VPQTTRLVRYEFDGAPANGLVVDDEVVRLDIGWRAALGLACDGDIDAMWAASTGDRAALDSVELLPCVDDGVEVYCVGLNYLEHQREAADLVDSIRDVPIIFGKSLRALTAPGADLVLPKDVSSEFDWEVELGVVIGRTAVDVAGADAWRHIAGYCVVNDITARDLQKRHQQWHLGKNVVRSTPVGPWVVARGDLDSPPDLEVSLRVNGVQKQVARTCDLIHDIPELVSLLSRITTLQPGDIIATGTPVGVGYKRTPPEFLSDGDVVETTVEGVGTLRNTVRTVARNGQTA
jgi:2-keto-4-pentenoate hydratase/2-oxohepta-3-ene-1,7-dioic acid hydratase in catechol pathway